MDRKLRWKIALGVCAFAVGFSALLGLLGLLYGEYWRMTKIIFLMFFAPLVLGAALLLLELFKGFEFQAACILYYVTAIVGMALADQFPDRDPLPWAVSFALGLSSALAVFYWRKTKKQ